MATDWRVTIVPQNLKYVLPLRWLRVSRMRVSLSARVLSTSWSVRVEPVRRRYYICYRPSFTDIYGVPFKFCFLDYRNHRGATHFELSNVLAKPSHDYEVTFPRMYRRKCRIPRICRVSS